jgi:hypothetical protein
MLPRTGTLNPMSRRYCAHIVSSCDGEALTTRRCTSSKSMATTRLLRCTSSLSSPHHVRCPDIRRSPSRIHRELLSWRPLAQSVFLKRALPFSARAWTRQQRSDDESIIMHYFHHQAGFPALIAALIFSSFLIYFASSGIFSTIKSATILPNTLLPSAFRCDVSPSFALYLCAAFGPSAFTYRADSWFKSKKTAFADCAAAMVAVRWSLRLSDTLDPEKERRVRGVTRICCPLVSGDAQHMKSSNALEYRHHP